MTTSNQNPNIQARLDEIRRIFNHATRSDYSTFPSDIIDLINNSEANYQYYVITHDTSDKNLIYKSLSYAKSAADYMATTATQILNRLKIDQTTEEAIKKIYNLSSQLRDSIKTDIPLAVSEKNLQDAEKQAAISARLDAAIESYDRETSRSRKEIEDTQNSVAREAIAVKQQLRELWDLAEKLSENISQFSKDAAAEIEKTSSEAARVKKEADSILGIASTNSLIVDYAHAARYEHLAAEITRAASLLCMTGSVSVLGLAFYDALNNVFDWEKSVIKIIIGILLSIPAAYLARESSKHRSQWHSNRRTAADLKAVSPYIASLPTEDQSHIKREVASRIFGRSESITNHIEAYPLNPQELLLALIERVKQDEKNKKN